MAGGGELIVGSFPGRPRWIVRESRFILRGVRVGERNEFLRQGECGPSACGKTLRDAEKRASENENPLGPRGTSVDERDSNGLSVPD